MAPLINLTTETPPILNKTVVEFIHDIIWFNRTCGLRNGENHPWLAILEHTNPNGAQNRKTLSKGILIHPQFVLTTISSIQNSHPFWVVLVNFLKLF